MTISTIEIVRGFRTMLEASDGLEASLETLRGLIDDQNREPGLAEVEFVRVPAALHDKVGPPRYPQVHVACEQIESRRTERLRAFSGLLRMVVEIRLSQDRLEGLTEQTLLYVDAVRDVLERKVGCVEGKFYVGGEYEVKIGAVERGGLHFLQVARVICPVLLNRE